MNYKLLTLMMLLVLMGCSSQTKRADDDTSDESAVSDQDFTLLDMLTISEIEPTIATENRPTTVEELVDEFIVALQDDPEKALINYADWQAVPKDEQMSLLASWMMSFVDSRDVSRKYTYDRHELTTVRVYARKCGQSLFEFNEGRHVPITHVLELRLIIAKGISSLPDLEIGQRDGYYYMYL